MRATHRLIVNADGFGFGAGATQGIFEALKGGFITSVSVNANFPEAIRTRELVRAFPRVSVGAHLNPMVGAPCLSPLRVPSLVGEDGMLLGTEFSRRLRRGRIALRELHDELTEQIRRVKEWAGDRLTHLDSQGNRHLSYLPLFLDLAREAGLSRMRNNASLICLESPTPRAARRMAYLRRPHAWLAHQYRRLQMARARAGGMRMADDLITVGYAGIGNKAILENWERILANLPEGTHEIYCHPAYPDETLRRWSYYREDRKRELEILRSPFLSQEASRLCVSLVSFDGI